MFKSGAHAIISLMTKLLTFRIIHNMNIIIIPYRNYKLYFVWHPILNINLNKNTLKILNVNNIT